MGKVGTGITNTEDQKTQTIRQRKLKRGALGHRKHRTHLGTENTGETRLVVGTPGIARSGITGIACSGTTGGERSEDACSGTTGGGAQ